MTIFETFPKKRGKYLDSTILFHLKQFMSLRTNELKRQDFCLKLKKSTFHFVSSCCSLQIINKPEISSLSWRHMEYISEKQGFTNSIKANYRLYLTQFDP